MRVFFGSFCLVINHIDDFKFPRLFFIFASFASLRCCISYNYEMHFRFVSGVVSFLNKFPPAVTQTKCFNSLTRLAINLLVQIITAALSSSVLAQVTFVSKCGAGCFPEGVVVFDMPVSWFISWFSSIVYVLSLDVDLITIVL